MPPQESNNHILTVGISGQDTEVISQEIRTRLDFIGAISVDIQTVDERQIQVRFKIPGTTQEEVNARLQLLKNYLQRRFVETRPQALPA